MNCNFSRVLCVFCLSVVLLSCGESEPQQSVVEDLGAPPVHYETEQAQEKNIALKAAQDKSRVTFTGRYLAGLYAFNNRRMQDAVGFMQEALAFDPENEGLLRQTFLVAVGSNNPEIYVPLAKQLLERDKQDFFVNLVLGVRAFSAEKYDVARRHLERVPAGEFQALLLPFVEAWLHMAENKPQEALKSLETVGISGELRPMVLLHQALIHMLNNNPQAAEKSFIEAQILMQNPPLRFYTLYGQFLQQQQKTEALEKLFADFSADGAQRLLRDSMFAAIKAGEFAGMGIVTNAKQGMAHALFDIASLLNQEYSRDIAIIYTRLALDLTPDFGFAALMMANLLEAERRMDDALLVLQDIKEESPFHILAVLQQVRLLEEQQLKEEALTALQHLADQYPDSLEVQAELADSLRRQEKFERAIEVYNNVVETLQTAEKDIPSQYWTIFYARGICFERTDQWEKAEADFLQALELSPQQPYVLNYLAYSWVEQGMHLEKAETMLLEAVKQRPEDGYIVDSVGWVYFKLGDYPKAISYLERAVELRPFDAVINDHLGDAYWKVGRYHEARFQWKRALSFDPEAEEREKIERKLKEGI